MDISTTALENAKQRLGEKAKQVHWIVTDVTEFISLVQFDFWYNKAAFHLLTNEEAVNKYVSVALRGFKKIAI